MDGVGSSKTDRADVHAEPPPGLVAARLIGLVGEAKADVLFIVRGEEGVERVAQALRALAPGIAVHRFPAWDCPAYDRAPPSREVMGARMRTLAALWRAADGPGIVLATVGAALQRTAPRDAVEAAQLTLETGERLDQDALRRFLLRTGFLFDERVDEPGEVAIRGQVIDIYPAGEAQPFRLVHDEEDRITAINRFDPLSQRTNGEIARLTVGPASELVSPEDAVVADAEGGLGIDRPPGIEHQLSRHYPRLGTLFEAMPRAVIAAEPGIEECRELFAEQVADAHQLRAALPAGAAGERPTLSPPEALYLDEAEWRSELDARRVVELEAAADAVPSFAIGAQPQARFADFVREALDRGARVVLVGANRRDLTAMARPLKRRLDRMPEKVGHWSAAMQAAAGTLLSLEAGLDRGFVTPDGRTVVVAAPDVLGSRASRPGADGAADRAVFELDLRPGDVVVHLDHGLGCLDGLERVTAEGAESEFVRLRYARDETLLVPVAESGRIWRYGSEPEAVTLDRLDSPALAAPPRRPGARPRRHRPRPRADGRGARRGQGTPAAAAGAQARPLRRPLPVRADPRPGGGSRRDARRSRAGDADGPARRR